MSCTVKLNLRTSHPKKSGECTIYLRLTINRKIHWINLKEHVHPEYWDDHSELEKIKSNHPRAKRLNIKLRKEYNRLREIIDQLEILGQTDSLPNQTANLF
ncbi:Arm DNA-binding domain-containing protein [Sediminitomix flava]|uniref:Integrase-like protein n=1 Tax=Sediminitomix flava TaxID=379075 RepID=A0A315Z5V2_SEDFL|nr:integrase-like protein [Sediminitomix flava]